MCLRLVYVCAAEGAAGSDRVHVCAQPGQPHGATPRGALVLGHTGRLIYTSYISTHYSRDAGLDGARGYEVGMLMCLIAYYYRYASEQLTGEAKEGQR
jgi:hypothetical protein